jgi:hypothetical protein
MRVDDSLDIRSGEQESLAVSSTVAVTAAAVAVGAGGRYAISCEEATVFLRVRPTSADADDVTVASAGGKGGFPLHAGNQIEIYLGEGDFIGAITAAAAGTLRWHRVGRL